MEVSANNLLHCRDSPILWQLSSGDGKGGIDRKLMSETLAVVREEKGDKLLFPTGQANHKEYPNSRDDELEKRKRDVMKNILSLSTVAQTGTQRSVLMQRKALQRKRRNLFDETPMMAEHELEKELEEEVGSGASIGSVYSSISAYLRALFLLPDARFNLRYLSNTESSSSGGTSKPASTSKSPSFSSISDVAIKTNSTDSASPDSPPQTLECSGPITSYCKNRLCRVKCIDGRKVEMVCGESSLDIKTSAVGDSITRNIIACSL